MNDFILAIWPWATALIGVLAVWILKRIERDNDKLVAQLNEISEQMRKNREELDHQISTIVRKFGERLAVVETRCAYVHGASADRRTPIMTQSPVHWSEDSDVKGMP